MAYTKKFKLTLLALLSCAAGSQDAWARDYEFNRMVEVTRPDRPKDVLSVSDYDRSDYSPVLARVGVFEVAPHIAAQAAHDDNVYAANTGKQDDLVTTVSPQVTVRSDWSRHEVVAGARADVVRYASNSGENRENFGAQLGGRADVMRNSYLTALARFDRRHEGRGAPNAAAASAKPTEYDQTHAQVGYVHAPTRVSVGAFVDYDRLDYKNGATTAGAPINNNLRDQQDVEVSVRASYEMSPGYRIFVQPSHKTLTYDAAASGGRNSESQRAVGGVELDLGGKVKAEVYGGYMHREYNNSALFPDVDHATFGIDAVWNINGLTSVEASLSRDTEETVNAGASGFINTSSSVTVEHELRRNIVLSETVRYQIHDYEGSTTTQRDTYLESVFGIRYWVNRNVAADVDYTYAVRDSNVANTGFRKNVIRAGIGLSF